MRRALRAGSILGAATVGLTVVSTLILIAFGQGQSVIFETAYTVNIVCYAVAAFRAVRFTGEPGQATLDSVVAATWAGALGTVLQGALLQTLNSGILVAVIVMLIIEWVSALALAPVCGFLGLLSRKIVPLRARADTSPAAAPVAAEGDFSAA
jgi:hypothetical protein